MNYIALYKLCETWFSKTNSSHESKCQKKSVIFRTNKFCIFIFDIAISEILFWTNAVTFNRKLVSSENSEKLKCPTVIFPRGIATFFELSDQIFLGKALFFVGRDDAIPSGRRLTPD